MSPVEAQKTLLDLSRKVQAGIQEQVKWAREKAACEREYRIGQRQAYERAPKGTAPERKAWVDAECAELREARDLAESMERVTDVALRVRMTEMSATQSLLAAFKAEASVTRYSPEFEP